MRKNTLSLLLASAVALAAADRATDHTDMFIIGEWSEAVDGLRARLHYSAEYQPGVATVYIEIQNVNTRPWPLEVYFDSDRFPFRPQVADDAGKRLGGPFGNRPGNYARAPVEPYWIMLPQDSSLRFRVTHGTYDGRDGIAFFPNSGGFWLIPTASNTNYFLSGTFVVEPPTNRVSTPTHPIWHGALTLPKVKLTLHLER